MAILTNVLLFICMLMINHFVIKVSDSFKVTALITIAGYSLGLWIGYLIS